MRTDLMDLDALKTDKKERQRCFKCSKSSHIRRFCKGKKKAVKILNLEDLKNNELLTLKESQKEEL